MLISLNRAFVVRLSNDQIMAETEAVLEEIANCLSADARVSKKET